MQRNRTLAIGVAAMLGVSAATAGAVFAVTTPPPNGDGPTTQWKAPENNLDAWGNAATQEIDQATNLWAQRMDAGDAAGVARLFTVSGTISLNAIDATTNPWTQVPTGYSPSPTPTGGTPGGGCSVTGQAQILRFLQGEGVTGNNPWPNMAVQRTLADDTLVKLNFPDRGEAYSATYIQSKGSGGSGTAQVFNTWHYSARTGWQIASMDILYQSAEPNLPCAN